MNNPDRYERAKQAHAKQSKEAERRAASLAITEAARVHADNEQKDKQRDLLTKELCRYADAALERLDQNGFPGIETVKVSKKALFGRYRYYETQKPGWHLTDTDFIYTIRGDECTGIRRWYLLGDGTFAQATYGVARQMHAGPPEPVLAGVIPPENIVDDDKTHMLVLKKLWELAGSPEVI